MPLADAPLAHEAVTWDWVSGADRSWSCEGPEGQRLRDQDQWLMRGNDGYSFVLCQLMGGGPVRREQWPAER